MTAFTYEALPMRVTFGVGRAGDVAAELDHLGLERMLVLSTPEQTELAQRVADGLGDRCVGLFPGAVMHVPIEVANEASDRAAELGADGCIAVGGGSTVGLGKAVALQHRLPVVAVPTTYAGSEMTPVWGLTENGVKKTGRDPSVLPRSVVYDPELTTSLPVDMSVTSGINALAHAAEALYAPDVSPVIALMAEEGARLVVEALPRVAADPDSLEARGTALRGAWLCGAVLGATTMSLHHKICHVLGGTFNLPHAAVHTVMLPYALSLTLPGAPDALSAMQRVLQEQDVPKALFDFSARLGAPTSLAMIGMPMGGVAEVVRQVMATPYASPRTVTANDIFNIVEQAMAGESPALPR